MQGGAGGAPVVFPIMEYGKYWDEACLVREVRRRVLGRGTPAVFPMLGWVVGMRHAPALEGLW